MSAYEVPEHFCCPLTMECMEDPLCSKYGHNFERRAILEWFDGGKYQCPITRQPLLPSMLVPNHRLRLKIKAWKAANEADMLLSDLEFEEEDDNGTLSRLLSTVTQAYSPNASYYSQRTLHKTTSTDACLGLGNEDEVQEIRRQARTDANRRDLVVSS